MSRVLISPDAVHDRLVTIRDRETLHHLRRVLRVKAGDRLECVDGRGRIYQGAIAQCSPQQIVIDVTRQAEEPPPPLRMTLAQALIKPDHFEWAIQKATELGVTRIVPLVTSRTTVRIEKTGTRYRNSVAVPGTKIARWRRIAAAATAQCGRARIPDVERPQPFAQALERLSDGERLLLTAGEGGTPIADAIRRLTRDAEVAVFIGPEGDFSPEEVALARRRGLEPVRLGRTILRAETAAVVTLSILQHAVGEFSRE